MKTTDARTTPITANPHGIKASLLYDTENAQVGGADLFLDYYAAKSKLLRYSSGLFAPKDSLILFSLYQCR